MHVKYNKPVIFAHLISFTNWMKVEAKQIEQDETFRMQTKRDLPGKFLLYFYILFKHILHFKVLLRRKHCLPNFDLSKL